MVAHVARAAYGPYSYRLTTHALVARAGLVGTLATVALSGECVSGVQWVMHRSIASRGAASQVRHQTSPASDSR